MQRLTRWIERDRFVFTESKLLLRGNKNHRLRRLVRKRKLDLLVVRVEDFQFRPEKRHVVQVVLCVLRVLLLLKLHQGRCFMLDEYYHYHVPAV